MGERAMARRGRRGTTLAPLPSLELPHVTDRHIAAAGILRRLADGTGIDLSRQPMPGSLPTARRPAQCYRQFAQAIAGFTPRESELVISVVLLGRDPGRERALLVACLDLLAAHFGAEVGQSRTELGNPVKHTGELSRAAP
jgi:hypothetical protein